MRLLRSGDLTRRGPVRVSNYSWRSGRAEVSEGEKDSMQGRTLVAGPDGPKRIEELRAGDRVWSRGNDGQLAEQKVISAWRSVDQELSRGRS